MNSETTKPCLRKATRPLSRPGREEVAVAYIFLYNTPCPPAPRSPKPVEFLGSSLDDLRAFPPTARREAGYQLDKVQNGEAPADWKPMNTIGQGVQEIRIRDDAGAFRVIYVARFADTIYVLHCFQKKTQATSKPDLDLATKRYRDLMKELGR